MSAPTDSSEDVGFVLVHGAGFDVWIWEELVSRMQAPTLSARFPAREADQSARDDLRLADYSEAVTEQVEEWDTSRVILVAHSIGGAVCMEVASRLVNRLTGFVGLSAGIPEPGQSFLSCFPFHQRVVQQAILRFAGTRPPERIIRGSLCAELTDEQADRVVTEFVPESRYLYTDPVDGIIPDVERQYIQTGTDESITPDQQAKMAVTLETDDVVTLNTGHLPMLSRPDELASVLEEFRTRIE
ncbi:alpha/beta hydrolase [Halogeometricum sp. S1BR25-6]|uniref:Alpha/beta hydrolase n=1 Tax=Halogeometricum salsisoli TaxID=2950536 RepID=A0ABU2GJZ1_9EURY|nr:alpha/beta hydrolase [Halogeometricum sp. S1BR25-6]MDS0301095.1 alpha/beta hydrolase [Halogeometricum sp. S1BR25-6]